MGNTIQIKTGEVDPVTLAPGEFGYNIQFNRLFIGDKNSKPFMLNFPNFFGTQQQENEDLRAIGIATETSYAAASSLAIGNNCRVESNYSLALGWRNKVLKDNSFVQGAENECLGLGACAQGNKTKAIGEYSHTEGERNEAIGSFSHVEGKDNSVEGKYCHVEGIGNVAKMEGCHVEGTYNDPYNLEYLHITGNGTDRWSQSNAFTIDKNGNGWFAGTIYLGGDSQHSQEAVNIRDLINSKSSNNLSKGLPINDIREYYEKPGSIPSLYYDETSLKFYGSSSIDELENNEHKESLPKSSFSYSGDVGEIRAAFSYDGMGYLCCSEGKILKVNINSKTITTYSCPKDGYISYPTEFGNGMYFVPIKQVVSNRIFLQLYSYSLQSGFKIEKKQQVEIIGLQEGETICFDETYTTFEDQKTSIKNIKIFTKEKNLKGYYTCTIYYSDNTVGLSQSEPILYAGKKQFFSKKGKDLILNFKYDSYWGEQSGKIILPVKDPSFFSEEYSIGKFLVTKIGQKYLFFRKNLYDRFLVYEREKNQCYYQQAVVPNLNNLSTNISSLNFTLPYVSGTSFITWSNQGRTSISIEINTLILNHYSLGTIPVIRKSCLTFGKFPAVLPTFYGQNYLKIGTGTIVDDQIAYKNAFAVTERGAYGQDFFFLDTKTYVRDERKENFGLRDCISQLLYIAIKTKSKIPGFHYGAIFNELYWGGKNRQTYNNYWSNDQNLESAAEAGFISYRTCHNIIAGNLIPDEE